MTHNVVNNEIHSALEINASPELKALIELLGTLRDNIQTNFKCIADAQSIESQANDAISTAEIPVPIINHDSIEPAGIHLRSRRFGQRMGLMACMSVVVGILLSLQTYPGEVSKILINSESEQLAESNTTVQVTNQAVRFDTEKELEPATVRPIEMEDITNELVTEVIDAIPAPPSVANTEMESCEGKVKIGSISYCVKADGKLKQMKQGQ